MTPRANLPTADELFRRTTEPAAEAEAPEEPVRSAPVSKSPNLQVATEPEKKPRHDEKVTFYCTAEDLTRLEAARLKLRAEHRLSTDRGRIVRAALAEVLEDFELRGVNSSLVRRLESG